MTGSMAALWTAAGLFLLVHLLPASPLRPALVDRSGEAAYRIGYSVVSLVLIAWMVMAYNAAPVDAVWWDAGVGGRHAASLLMLFAAIFFINAFIGPNPTSAGSEKTLATVDPGRGFLAVTRHPFLWGAGLWGLAHLIANGDAPSAVFFGTFALLSLGGTVLIDWRKGRTAGPDWQRFRSATSNLPFRAMVEGRAPFRPSVLWWRVLAGVALYVAVLVAHPWLFSVDPLG